jgi:hypothetical protein
MGRTGGRPRTTPRRATTRLRLLAVARQLMRRAARARRGGRRATPRRAGNGHLARAAAYSCKRYRELFTGNLFFFFLHPPELSSITKQQQALPLPVCCKHHQEQTTITRRTCGLSKSWAARGRRLVEDDGFLVVLK